MFKILRSSGLIKGNQYEFRKHPKIKWLDRGLESPPNHFILNWGKL